MRILNGIFAGTIFNIVGGLTLAKLGFNAYQQIKSNENYIIMEEIKPRTRTDVYSQGLFNKKIRIKKSFRYFSKIITRVCNSFESFAHKIALITKASTRNY
jgi:hypothetical protein